MRWGNKCSFYIHPNPTFICCPRHIYDLHSSLPTFVPITLYHFCLFLFSRWPMPLSLVWRKCGTSERGNAQWHYVVTNQTSTQSHCSQMEKLSAQVSVYAYSHPYMATSRPFSYRSWHTDINHVVCSLIIRVDHYSLVIDNTVTDNYR